MAVAETRIRIEIPFEDTAVLAAVLQSLKIEEETQASPNRIRLEVFAEGSNLICAVNATDLTAARAASNSVLRWIELATKVAGQ